MIETYKILSGIGNIMSMCLQKIPNVSHSVTRSDSLKNLESRHLTEYHIMILESILFVIELLTFGSVYHG